MKGEHQICTFRARYKWIQIIILAVHHAGFQRLPFLVPLFHPELKSDILKAISQQVVCFT